MNPTFCLLPEALSIVSRRFDSATSVFLLGITDADSLSALLFEFSVFPSLFCPSLGSFTSFVFFVSFFSSFFTSECFSLSSFSKSFSSVFASKFLLSSSFFSESFLSSCFFSSFCLSSSFFSESFLSSAFFSKSFLSSISFSSLILSSSFLSSTFFSESFLSSSFFFSLMIVRLVVKRKTLHKMSKYWSSFSSSIFAFWTFLSISSGSS